MLKTINHNLSRLLTFKTQEVKVSKGVDDNEYMIYVNHPLLKVLQISLNVTNEEGVKFVILTINGLIDNLLINFKEDNGDLLDDLTVLKDFIDSFTSQEKLRNFYFKAKACGDYLC